MRKFRTYMIVGGMPQAVSAFVETNSFLEADVVKRDILDLYGNDFMKFDPTGRASAMFKAIPAELQKNASRYQVSSVLANERADSMLPVLNKLVDSKTVNIAYHANNPEAGLMQNIDVRKFKLFMADTGLFVTQCFRDRESGGCEVFDKLVTGRLGANLGYVFENAVAQAFAANGDGLFYHTFKSETSNHNHEVDFLLARGSKVCPVEVKSGNSAKHKSLDVFAAKFSGRILRQYVIHAKEIRREGEVLAIPCYMAAFL